MGLTRRAFLAGGSAAAATAALGPVPRPEHFQRFAARPRLAWAGGRSQAMPAPSPAVHLLNRATFGATAAEAARVERIGIDAWIEEQLDAGSIDDAETATALSKLESLGYSMVQLKNNGGKRPLRPELIAGTLYRMVNSRRQLFEVMVDHWSSHFNVYHIEELIGIVKTADDRDVARAHALGSFRAMLHASARSLAMMRYLDTLRNVKGGPNENYAREVMELHTLGAAVNGVPYTEHDVKDVARCFTGWGRNNDTWAFQFFPDQHDTGRKTVLGRPITATGDDEGREVLDRLVDHPRCALHVARRLVRRFVADDPPADLVESVAGAFGRDGDIRAMLRVLLHSDAFKSAHADGGGVGPAKLRRPLEVWAAALRATGADTAFLLDVSAGAYEGEHGAASEYANRAERYLELMDHVPFRWRSPDGYPDVGPRWKGMHMMIGRWNYGLALCENRLDGIRFDFYGQMARAGVSREPGEMVDYWAGRILNRPLLAEDRDLLVEFIARGASGPIGVDAAQARLPMLVALLLDSPYFQRR